MQNTRPANNTDTDDMDYDALADWAQTPESTAAFAEAAKTSTPATRDTRHESVRALLAAALPADPAQDSPLEAFARNELNTTSRGRGRGRPTLTGTTGTGKSRARQVRLPTDLDQRLTAYTSRAHLKPSEVMREAIASYLDRQQSG
ncbi:hypothetical protein [Pengzhenrongella sp.]|jgi:hypothetical protein|uniref:hypothetical protein n=1 Tax=Pengzhenrongella sp. TaxID=2888820 RepID=UPI002F957C55